MWFFSYLCETWARKSWFKVGICFSISMADKASQYIAVGKMQKIDNQAKPMAWTLALIKSVWEFLGPAYTSTILRRSCLYFDFTPKKKKKVSYSHGGGKKVLQDPDVHSFYLVNFCPKWIVCKKRNWQAFSFCHCIWLKHEPTPRRTLCYRTNRQSYGINNPEDFLILYSLVYFDSCEIWFTSMAKEIVLVYCWSTTVL